MTESAFFSYARERQLVMLARRAGESAPWTQDPILQQYRFCNVFREDDRTTKWFREHMRDPLSHLSNVVFATICFRWFNRIETGEILLKHDLHANWDPELAWDVLKDQHPLVTGAFMVKTTIGVSPKLKALIELLTNVWVGRSALLLQWDKRSLMRSWELLLGFPYLGKFMAYEMVTDLRHTDMLANANDICEWANPGPGALRGAGRVVYNDPTHFKGTVADYEEVGEIMRFLLLCSKQGHHWPTGLSSGQHEWPAWEMREVEHTLCEFDKYERSRLGEGRLKRKYP
jgi:hypothetical protein